MFILLLSDQNVFVNGKEVLKLVKGKCIILNQYLYSKAKTQWEPREGTKKDEEELVRTFKKYGCAEEDFVILQDLTGSQIKEKMAELAKRYIFDSFQTAGNLAKISRYCYA